LGQEPQYITFSALKGQRENYDLNFHYGTT